MMVARSSIGYPGRKPMSRTGAASFSPACDAAGMLEYAVEPCSLNNHLGYLLPCQPNCTCSLRCPCFRQWQQAETLSNRRAQHLSRHQMPTRRSLTSSMFNRFFALIAKSRSSAVGLWDQQHVLAALQGLVNRDRPRLYIQAVGPEAKIDRYWLEKLRGKGQWLAEWSVRPQSDLVKLVARYREFVRGVVVWTSGCRPRRWWHPPPPGWRTCCRCVSMPEPRSLYHRLVEAEDGPRLEVKLRLLNADGSPMFTGSRSGIPRSVMPSSGWSITTSRRASADAPGIWAYFPDAWWLSRQG